jgi:hypothetical protein
MIRRNTWIVLGIFALLLASTLLMNHYNVSLVKGTPTATTAPVLLADWPLNSTTELKYETTDQAAIDLKKNGDNSWYSVSIDNKQVNQGSVSEVISALSSLKPLSEVDLSAGTEGTGLDNPTATLKLTDGNGTVRVITIGSPTKTDSGYYATVTNHSKVVVLEKNSVEEIKNALSSGQVFATPEIISDKGTSTPTANP